MATIIAVRLGPVKGKIRGPILPRRLSAFEKFRQCGTAAGSAIVKEPLRDFIRPDASANVGITAHPGAEERIGMHKKHGVKPGRLNMDLPGA